MKTYDFRSQSLDSSKGILLINHPVSFRCVTLRCHTIKTCVTESERHWVKLFLEVRMITVFISLPSNIPSQFFSGFCFGTSCFLGARVSLFLYSITRFSIVTTTMSSVKPFERLCVLLKNYKLTLQPNLTEFTLTGEEVIDVEVR